MDKYQHFRLETDREGVAWLWLDVAESKVNVLSSEVLKELGQLLTALEANPPKGLSLGSAKPSGFCAGADVREFTKISSRDQALALIGKAHQVFQRLESLPCPTVARIHGHCLGGGLELALACRYRVALDDPKTRLGLPEILLGIHPGFGGSVRLIRTIGAPKAFELMLSGNSLDAPAAARCGLVDYAVPERHLDRACRHLLATQPRPRRPGWVLRLADWALVRPWLAAVLRRQVANRAKPEHYPAPYALIELWRRYGAKEAMFQAEAESVAELLLSETCRNLVRVFFLRERLKGFGRGDEVFHRVHAVGAGVMGGDIAAWCVAQGLSASVQDLSPQRIAPAVQRAYRLFARTFKRRHEEIAARDRLIPDSKGVQLPRAEVVIEAIVENLEAKQALYRQIEPRLGEDALLATNTSSLPLEALAKALKRPERLVGLHFFNPVARMPLVEVVQGERSDPKAVEKACAFVRAIAKLPLPVKSAPGFLVNRVLMPYLMEAMILLEERVPPEAIDRAATEFGMPMGPIHLADTVGLDVCLAVAEILTQALGGQVPELLRAKVADGKLGVKRGEGFYRYRRGQPLTCKRVRSPLPQEAITERLILRLLNECVAVLREKLVEDADLIDAGMVLGTGFAPFRGGPMQYLKQRGIEATRARLEALAQEYGLRFQPDAGWEKLQGVLQ
ncbi:3-hydroxyacyl-CoA dehydrogenase NAD-binding domain-containing protein [Methylothermus subterraneus]